MNDKENIIHVRFGPGGGKQKVLKQKNDCASSLYDVPSCREEPFYDLYNLCDAAKLFDISKGRLIYWERSNFIVRSARVGRNRFYTFQDLVGIRVAKELLEKGIPLRNVKRSVEALCKSLPQVARPLSSLRIMVDGQKLLVKDDNRSYDPITGQLVLNFDVSSIRDDIVRVLSRERNTNEYRNAYEYYLEGCRLDEDENTYLEAETAYRQAIGMDPSFSNAFTNLGNLLFRRGELEKAEDMYRKALLIDPEQPEALYNIGFMKYDQGDLQKSVLYFKRAINSDPSFADAHFNLAMVLEELEQVEEAKMHWKAYTVLDPDTPWAEIAHKHLDS